MIRQQTVREMFDDISLNVIAFLEVIHRRAASGALLIFLTRRVPVQNHRAVSKVTFLERPPASLGAFSVWEQVAPSISRVGGACSGTHRASSPPDRLPAPERNSFLQANQPCVLPDDFKNLCHISDGLLLRWETKIHGADRLRVG